MAARYGVARGLFSNESGLGSAPIAAAAAITRNPVRQALVSMTGTFWDTVVVCLMTGLVLTTSIMRNPAGFEGLEGGDLTYQAFQLIPVIGPIILVVGLATFAYSTILGWAYYGERSVEYLLGKKALLPYRILFSITTFIGATTALTIVWNFSDLMNACMAIPNLIALLLLSGVLVSETKKYLWDDNLDLRNETPIPLVDKPALFRKGLERMK
jgi:AGCS family alanine or glycine:cation symporter